MGKRDSYQMVAEDDPGWLRFWSNYPKLVAKKDARQAWSKLNPSPALIDTMLTALEWQRPMWAKDSYRFCPYPASWLNGQRWEDVKPGTKKPEFIGSAVRCWYGHQPPCASSSECKERFFREAREKRAQAEA